MSTNYEPEKYLPTIDAILSVANLEEITVKKIRNALQELFGIDLSPNKKDINEIILNRYYDLIHKREEESKKQMEKQDALLAAKLSREENGGRRAAFRQARKSAAKVEKPKRPLSANNVFNRQMVLSADLQAIVNKERLSRAQVVKHLWAYIKENNLQNPKDKRQIDCDDKLQNLFKKKSVDSFGMNKILSKHIFKPEEVGDSTTASAPKHDEEQDEESEEGEGEEEEEEEEEVEEAEEKVEDGDEEMEEDSRVSTKSSSEEV
ncbi:unnamed protein product [Candida verbasci]|uniref:DM2 domain-containing protein n=1 Tax=Candida verbasci TaxID=1227364 RepID=A0A9W4TZS7_9ASCO|nr:unnamed protein product [Candida verbasci]